MPGKTVRQKAAARAAEVQAVKIREAERVPVTVLEKNSEEAAVESVLEKTDQVIVGSEKYVEEGDQIRIKG